MSPVRARSTLRRICCALDGAVDERLTLLIERRPKDAFLAIKYEVHGAQNDAVGAEALAAKDKHEFERWIVGAIEGQPYGGGKIRRAWTRAIYRWRNPSLARGVPQSAA